MGRLEVLEGIGRPLLVAVRRDEELDGCGLAAHASPSFGRCVWTIPTSPAGGLVHMARDPRGQTRPRRTCTSAAPIVTMRTTPVVPSTNPLATSTTSSTLIAWHT